MMLVVALIAIALEGEGARLLQLDKGLTLSTTVAVSLELKEGESKTSSSVVGSEGGDETSSGDSTS